jgi:hypothetical protein
VGSHTWVTLSHRYACSIRQERCKLLNGAFLVKGRVWMASGRAMIRSDWWSCTLVSIKPTLSMHYPSNCPSMSSYAEDIHSGVDLLMVMQGVRIGTERTPSHPGMYQTSAFLAQPLQSISCCHLQHGDNNWTNATNSSRCMQAAGIETST